MLVSSVLLEIDKAQVRAGIERAIGMLDGSDTEVVLDFTSVARVDANELKLLEKLAGGASEKAARVVLRGVNVRIYKALKLASLTERFGFEK